MSRTFHRATLSSSWGHLCRCSPSLRSTTGYMLLAWRFLLTFLFHIGAPQCSTACHQQNAHCPRTRLYYYEPVQACLAMSVAPLDCRVSRCWCCPPIAFFLCLVVFGFPNAVAYPRSGHLSALGPLQVRLTVCSMMYLGDCDEAVLKIVALVGWEVCPGVSRCEYRQRHVPVLTLHVVPAGGTRQLDEGRRSPLPRS